MTFIRGTSNYSYGQILVDPVASNPEYKYLNYGPVGAADPYPSGERDGFRDATMLGYWGSVVVEANTTGFAMEFIGDINDSTGGVLNNCESIIRAGSTTSKRSCISSGVNLQ